MANCPKCGYKLRMIDIKAECPKCGVNLLYYNQQERLAQDADKAEEEHINFQPKIDRIKFSFIGTKLSILRLILIFVPIGMLFLPLAHIGVQFPYNPIDTNVSILNIVMDFLMKQDLGWIFEMMGTSEFGAPFICLGVSVLSILIAAVFAILNLVLVALSSSPKGFKRNIALSVCGIVFTVISIITFLVFNSQVSGRFGDVYSGSLGIGAFLVIVGFLALIAVNIIIKKKNIPVKYTDVSEYVERIAKRKEEIAAMEAEAEALKKAYLEKQAAAANN